MKTSDTILLKLVGGKATITAIAEQLAQPPSIVAAFCDDLELDGLVAQEPIGNPSVGRKLAAWCLTESGKSRVEQLQATA